jgi:hypothetical protein
MLVLLSSLVSVAISIFSGLSLVMSKVLLSTYTQTLELSYLYRPILIDDHWETELLKTVLPVFTKGS